MAMRVLAIAAVPADALAQVSGIPALRRVEGRVVRGTRGGPQPVANVWVVLHRVGSDTAGALDSARTTAKGAFGFRYRPFGDSAAVYFVSATYGGIAYFTPLPRPDVRGEDGTITVFDTTSTPIRIAIGGRHVIVAAPSPNGRRPIGEVYDLQNDTTVTLVARGSAPLWTTRLPARAEGFQLNANANIAPAAVTRRGDTVGLFAPLSPGVRQLAFTYDLPGDAFPVTLRVDRPTGVLELLVQEQNAVVEGPGLEEEAPVTTEGRTFRRFLAKEVPADASFRVGVPAVGAAQLDRLILVVGVVIAGAMLATLVVALRRRAPSPRPAPAAVTARALPSQRLLREIAALDAAFERAPSPDSSARAEYVSRRAALKAQLAEALAAERQRA
jgi:hypothetical protein